MLEFALIIIGIIVAILLIPYLLWKWLISGSLQTALIEFFKTLQGNDLRVDPEAPIEPSERQPISEVFEQRAEQMKHQQPLQHQPAPAQTTLPLNGIAQNQNRKNSTGTILENRRPDLQNPDTIDQSIGQNQVAQMPPAVEEPVQPLVEDNTFKVDDPIIDEQYIDPDTPSADTLDAHIPKFDSSPYGVRSADHSPGRRLRDKRYRRNSS